MSTSIDPQFELRFESLFERDCYVFPCDAKGHVDLDALSERDLNNYLYARHAIGREVARPAVRPQLPDLRIPAARTHALTVGARNLTKGVDDGATASASWSH